MKEGIFSTILLFLVGIFPVCAQHGKDLQISEDIELIQLSDDVYLHVSYLQTKTWGRVGANGLLLVKNGEALIIDTPWNNDQTEELFNWVKDSFHATITEVIPTHWHEDCMGGLAYLHSKGARSYAGQKTIDIAQKNNLAVPQTAFVDSLLIDFQGTDIECFYFGGAHTIDVIAVWLPSENILFAGDIAREKQATNLGNIADADIKAWSQTLEKIIARFPTAKIVIPGHGQIGGIDLLKHTIDLLK